MIRIGDFARLSRVSVKTLRLYDELGLIKPVKVDEFTSYRYYDYDQYPLMNRIRALKDLGFSLEEIGRLLKDGMTSQQMQAMLRLRAAEIEQRIGDEHGRLARVEAWLQQIEREHLMTQYDVVVKRVPAMRTANIRKVIPHPAEQGPLWATLFRYLEEHNAQIAVPCLTLYYDEETPDKDWDLEVSIPITGPAPDAGPVRVRDLPAVEAMACVLHSGPFLTIDDAYASLSKWIDENGMRVCGAAREVLIRPPAATESGADQTDPSTVVEVQMPIEKVAAGAMKAGA